MLEVRPAWLAGLSEVSGAVTAMRTSLPATSREEVHAESVSTTARPVAAAIHRWIVTGVRLLRRHGAATIAV